MGEPKEVERLWSPQTRFLSSLDGEPPELKQPGLVLIERQTKLGQALIECIQQPPSIAFMLGSNDRIIGVANDHDLAARVPGAPLVYPGVKAVVQEDVGQERANHASYKVAKRPDLGNRG